MRKQQHDHYCMLYGPISNREVFLVEQVLYVPVVPGIIIYLCRFDDLCGLFVNSMTELP